MSTLAEQLTSVFQVGLEHSDEALRKSLSAALTSVNNDSDPIDGIEGKCTKSEANYRKADVSDERCNTCEHYDRAACDIVSGGIKPEYVCDFFDRNEEPRTDPGSSL